MEISSYAFGGGKTACQRHFFTPARMAVLERRVKLLREARRPTHAELRWAFENLWTLRGFSLGRLFDAFQLWPQVDSDFQREVKFLVNSARKGMATPRAA